MNNPARNSYVLRTTILEKKTGATKVNAKQKLTTTEPAHYNPLAPLINGPSSVVPELFPSARGTNLPTY